MNANRCIGGVYSGIREFAPGPHFGPSGAVAMGFFGRSDIDGDCNRPVAFLCRSPGITWYACDDPDHQTCNGKPAHERIPFGRAASETVSIGGAVRDRKPMPKHEKPKQALRQKAPILLPESEITINRRKALQKGKRP